MEKFEFDGSFYPFEDNEGNGIIIKLQDDENENENDDEMVYEMCIEECECFVECEKNDDCGNGNGIGIEEMECVEYKCVDKVKGRRKETNSEDDDGFKKRRVAAVSIFIPMSICLFGVFTSFYLAQNYGDQELVERCREACPDDVDVKLNTVNVREEEKKKRVYLCSGKCEYLKQELQVNLVEGISINTEKYDTEILDSLYDEETFFYILDKNEVMLKHLCSEKETHQDIVASSEKEALIIFQGYGDADCGKFKYQWRYNEEIEGATFKDMYDFPPFTHVCRGDRIERYCHSY